MSNRIRENPDVIGNLLGEPVGPPAEYECCVCAKALHGKNVIKYAGRRFCDHCHEDYTGIRAITNLNPKAVINALKDLYFHSGAAFGIPMPTIDWDSKDPIGSNSAVKSAIEKQLRYSRGEVDGVAPKMMDFQTLDADEVEKSSNTNNSLNG